MRAQTIPTPYWLASCPSMMVMLVTNHLRFHLRGIYADVFPEMDAETLCIKIRPRAQHGRVATSVASNIGERIGWIGGVAHLRLYLFAHFAPGPSAAAPFSYLLPMRHGSTPVRAGWRSGDDLWAFSKIEAW